MNIFALDNDPSLAAKYHCDKHVVKMIMETLMLLRIATARLSRTEHLWGHAYTPRRYKNHPCAKWVSRTYENYKWTRQLGIDLCKEYSFRYGKIHKLQQDIITSSPPTRVLQISWNIFCAGGLDPFYLNMPSELHSEEAPPFICYRAYYITHKHHLLTYTKREIPWWLQDLNLGVQK